MISIEGYSLVEKLHAGRSIVYRAIRKIDDQHVILKVILSENISDRDNERLEKEQKIIKHLNLEEIPQVYSLEKSNGYSMLVLEDVKGISIGRYLLQHTFDLMLFLEIAIKISDIVAKIHANSVIHKDLKPDNIIFDPETRDVKIIDFSISSTFPRESKEKRIFNELEGTLLYVSPEQTGWMYRFIDYRTDFYTLGITFYQMLAGHPPFVSDDPLELIHSHLAKTPEPLKDLEPGFPEVLSDIVDKLLSKNAEDRYKSALGLRYDLNKCLKELTGSEIAKFALGEKDFSDQFRIPQKLYGREDECRRLYKAYEEVSNNSDGIVLIGGEPGIGKSALVQELYKPVVQRSAFFITGKFDQSKKDIPYGAFVQIFEDLANQVLTRNPKLIEEWKNELLKSLGGYCSVIVRMVPRWEYIIGRQDLKAEIPSIDLQSRFYFIFQEFLRVFSSKEKPLVIFIDDIQWADFSSIKLMEYMMTNREYSHILFIVAYRSNEFKKNTELVATISRIKEFRKSKNIESENFSPITELNIDVISVMAINQLLMEILNSTDDEIEMLALLLKEQTAGNPFYINQFLTTIYHEHLLVFDNHKYKWNWDISTIKSKGFTDNIIQLMAVSISKGSAKSLEALKIASCLGLHFNLEMLSIISGISIEQLSIDLKDSVNAGYIIIVDENSQNYRGTQFRFQHDEILYTANSMLDPEIRKTIHLKVGEFLIKRLVLDLFIQEETDIVDSNRKEDIFERILIYSFDEINLLKLYSLMGDSIFSIVNHINLGRDKVQNIKSQLGLAVLNLFSSWRARKAGAFHSALDYINNALTFLPQNSWDQYYFLTLQVYIEAAECEYLNINFEKSHKICGYILTHSQTIYDKLNVFELNIKTLTPQNKFMEAIHSGRIALEGLGIILPENPTKISPLPDLILAYLKMAHKLEKLIDLPMMQGKKNLSAMNILLHMITPAFISNPDLAPLLVLKMVHLTLDFGLSSQSAYGFAFFSMILGSALGNYDKGETLAKISLKLIDKLPQNPYECKVLFIVANMVLHWKGSLKKSQDILEKAYHKGLDSGDLLFASYSLNWFMAYNYLTRKNLKNTLEQMNHYLTGQNKLRQQDATDFYLLWMQFVATISENKKLSGFLKGEYFDEEVVVTEWEITKNDTVLYVYEMMKGIIFYFKKEYEKALVHLEKAIPHESGVFGMPVIVEHNFFYSLVLISICRENSSSGFKKRVAQVKKNQNKLKKWSSSSPENYLHKYLIIKAELLSFKNVENAISVLELAIRSSVNNGFILEQAIANELISLYHSKQGKHFIANAYLSESYNLFLRWGALGKIALLEEENPELIYKKNTQYADSYSGSKNTWNTTHHTIDLKTVLKASQNISSEIDLNRLIEKLVLIAMENAGADRGYLLLERDDKLYIEAEGENSVVKVINSVPLDEWAKLPLAVINYVEKTKELLVINDTSTENQFQSDSFLLKEKPRSILCLPVVKIEKLIGILYLENTLLTGVFTNERLDLLNLLSTQVIISLENAIFVNKIKMINSQLADEIVEHQKTETELTLSRERFALAANGANDGLWDWDLKAGTIFYSSRWKSILGYNDGEISGYPGEWFKMVHENDISLLRACIDSHLEGSLPFLECEYRMKHKDGNYIWMLTRGLAVRNEQKIPYRMAGSQTEITKRKLAEEQLLHDALYDSLTGLPNWNLLQDRIDHALKKKTRQPEYIFAVLFLDVDRFKVVNDSLGHDTGNCLLVSIARSLETCLRPEDTVARLGGDEFGILLEGINDINEALHITSRLLESFITAFKVNDQELFVTISIGMVVSNSEYRRSQEMLRDADTAMHRAKVQGRNRYELFDKTMHANILQYITTEGNMRKAFERRDFILHYQPIVAALDGKILGVEALIRWPNEGNNFISPEIFIPIAEESGLIVSIGEWVLLEALKNMKKWHDMGYPLFDISINISGRQVANKNFIQFVKGALRESGINPYRVQFELTESVLMDNIAHAIHILEELKTMGIRIVIDDFGTGYSSLNYLKQFPVNKLKIDRSFIKHMVNNKNDAALVRAIIAMGESMQMRVVAEGVETDAQLKILQNDKCHEIQGFYFSKPLEENEFIKLFTSTRCINIADKK